MQLPGGSARVPPARAPASLLAIINGGNIASSVANERSNGSRNSNGSGGQRDSNRRRNLRKSSKKRNRDPETRKARRQREILKKPKLLASAPRRKDRGEE